MEDTLYYYIYPCTIPTSVTYRNLLGHPQIDGIHFQAYWQGSVMMKPHTLNSK